jgi:hypothetical protein
MKNKLIFSALIVLTTSLWSCQVCDEVMSLNVKTTHHTKKLFNRSLLPVRSLTLTLPSESLNANEKSCISVN